MSNKYEVGRQSAVSGWVDRRARNGIDGIGWEEDGIDVDMDMDIQHGQAIEARFD